MIKINSKDLERLNRELFELYGNMSLNEMLWTMDGRKINEEDYEEI